MSDSENTAFLKKIRVRDKNRNLSASIELEFDNIENTFLDGYSLKFITNELNKKGYDITVDYLYCILSRIRKKRKAQGIEQPQNNPPEKSAVIEQKPNAQQQAKAQQGKESEAGKDSSPLNEWGNPEMDDPDLMYTKLNNGQILKLVGDKWEPIDHTERQIRKIQQSDPDDSIRQELRHYGRKKDRTEDEEKRFDFLRKLSEASIMYIKKYEKYHPNSLL